MVHFCLKSLIFDVARFIKFIMEYLKLLKGHVKLFLSYLLLNMNLISNLGKFRAIRASFRVWPSYAGQK